MILSDLDQQPLANALDIRGMIQDPINATARTTRLSVFLCPADAMPPVWTAVSRFVREFRGKILSDITPIWDVAGANYVGMFGVGEPGVDGNGVFFRNTFVRPADVTDGLSQTVRVGERSVLLNGGRGQATWVGSVIGASFSTSQTGKGDPDAAGPCIEEAPLLRDPRTDLERQDQRGPRLADRRDPRDGVTLYPRLYEKAGPA
jgi:hypothetical protein